MATFEMEIDMFLFQIGSIRSYRLARYLWSLACFYSRLVRLEVAPHSQE